MCELKEYRVVELRAQVHGDGDSRDGAFGIRLLGYHTVEVGWQPLVDQVDANPGRVQVELQTVAYFPWTSLREGGLDPLPDRLHKKNKKQKIVSLI